ncbi:MAG: type II secretion system protein GspG [Acidobacteria bacterium]|nr:type II secretion system protein GspG [Acidobacteriota bacterium]
MAAGSKEDERHAVSHPPLLSKTKGRVFLVFAFALCLLSVDASAQKKPKPALKASDARRAVAEAPGFALSKGAVKVKEVSPAGSTPVTVSAVVTEAFRLVRVEDERVEQTGGVFRVKRWRAAEFRTGDRAWEEFELFAEAVGPERLEAARAALEELVTEFEARQAKVGAGWEVTARTAEEEAVNAGKSGSKKQEKKREEEKQPAAEPLTRGPLTIKQLSFMGSSAVAEVEVAGVFTLARDARGRWRATGFEVGGETVGDPEALWRAVNERKAARARADLAEIREALDAFRRERGFYVVGEDSVVLFDHLSPRYARRVIRLDPWHNPYRYNGTQASYTLTSDGPDGKRDTTDDIGRQK